MKLHSLEDLFVCLLSDVYVVETQLVKDLPLFMEKASNSNLKTGVEVHLQETKKQVQRLDEIFKLIDKKPTHVEWAGNVKNLHADAQKFLEENPSSPLLDAAIIAIAQRVEHFEIATYGTLIELAKVLGYDTVSEILNDTIKEEGHADKLLTKIAEGGVFTKGINAEASSR